MASVISASTTSATALNLSGDTSGVLQIATGATPTPAVTVDSSQNVGVGTASPAVGLDVVNNVNNSFGQFRLSSSGSYGTRMTFTSTSTNGRTWQIGSNFATGNGEFAFTDYTAGAERMRIDANGNLLFNSGYGSVATAYGCRAWANWNGASSGTITPRGSGGVTSVTKNGTGDYTINLNFTMPDANYAVCLTTGRSDGNNGVAMVNTGTTPTTTSIRIQTIVGSATLFDSTYVYASFFR